MGFIIFDLKINFEFYPAVQFNTVKSLAIVYKSRKLLEHLQVFFEFHICFGISIYSYNDTQ